MNPPQQTYDIGASTPEPNTELSLAHEQLEMSNALLAATAYILQGRGARELIVRLCDALMQAAPHVQLAWFWLGDAMAQQIQPQIAVGPARAWAEGLTIPRDWLVARGPVYALPTPQDMGVREASLQHIRSVMALPVSLNEGRNRALLAFYADQPDYFERVGLAPFRALARFAEVALERSRLNDKLERLAATDTLTGLLSRRAMTNQVQSELERCAEQGGSLALLLFDIDRFKRINDRYGHDVGDIVIKQVSQVAKAQLRDQDAAGRWGGEEFLMLVTDADHEIGVVVAERVRHQIRLLSVQTEKELVRPTVSVGVAIFSADGQTMEQLIRVADKRLYEAKERGRDRVVA